MRHGRPIRLLTAASLVLAWAVPASAQAAAPSAHPARLHAATERAMIALAPNDPIGLAAYAHQVTSPGSAVYHRYLSVTQFRRQFGASSGDVARVRRALAARGLRAGRLARNGLELPVAAAAGSAAAATAAAPQIRSVVRALGNAGDGPVQGVIGAEAQAPSTSLTLRSAAHDAGTPVSAATGSSAQPCTGASSAAADGGYLAGQIAAAYGMSGYRQAGDDGTGVTVALYELEPFSAADVAAYQACYGSDATVTTVPVDGGAGTGAGSGEAAMDIETLIGLAPGANIRVYEGPDTGLGAYDTYSRIVTDDTAQVISTSWGKCEALEGAGAAAAEQTLFEEAAVQGQSVLAASGDDGSNDCGRGSPAVDDPASQPWVTAVGATSLVNGQNLVWNDSYGASGGGQSRLWPRPSYQDGVATAGACPTSASCREVPDLSIDGDPAAGYVAYYEGAWRIVGGSSVAAPAIAALAALADASPACGHHPLGFLNPILYGAAASDYPGNFGDVTVGDNGVGGVPGFSAGTGYDMASGLGTPGPALGATLCASASTAPAPAQTSSAARLAPHRNLVARVGTRIRIRVTVHGRSRAPLRFAASDLPPGLRIDARTGVISGSPRAPGTGTSHLRASGSAGGALSTTLRWRIRPRQR